MQKSGGGGDSVLRKDSAVVKSGIASQLVAFHRPVTRCEAVGRPKGSVDPEGVPTMGPGVSPENFLEIQV